MTNVTTGDLARIVAAGSGHAWTKNYVVRIGGRCGCAPEGAVYWHFTEPLMDDGRFPVTCAADVCLKRIDPKPEPDALPAPARERECEQA